MENRSLECKRCSTPEEEKAYPSIIINDYCIRFNNELTGAESLHFSLFFSLSLSLIFFRRETHGPLCFFFKATIQNKIPSIILILLYERTITFLLYFFSHTSVNLSIYKMMGSYQQ
ncbi:hypothetical protein I4U23_031047 [Adineta vaga]|nr:hypothetical protein I4U23_031047 [Adineta vaga]